MLEKSTNTTEKYKINSNTTVTVKNNRIDTDQGGTVFKADVTLKHKVVSDKPISFSSPDEIADFVNNIDMDDNQLSLLDEQKDEE